MASTETVLDKEDLRATVAQVVEVDVDEIHDDTSLVDDLGVDSLMALEVVVVLEKKYGVRMTESELKQVTSLQRAYDLLAAKLRTP
ncbi:acyl carrier protein [Planosporangium thailandense]|uniref:Acyl carrier protein n=1 Tax=Planosporangium thailandense TaxID=765197 RepID=A0ABX0XX97_9ACTN|nr:acyl carrier protein [Planosporangium thailandense]NJC70666.1 acyl carrier protein [Planosporangium thailandense]